MPSTKDLELAHAAYKTVRDIVRVKKGESLLITIDSVSDFRVAEEMAKAGEALGAKVMVAWHSTPKGYGQATDPYLPAPLIEACPAADAWIELNNQWLLYGTPWQRAVTNGRTRNFMLGGLSTDQLIRCIGEVDIDAQVAFQEKVVELTKQSKKMTITNAAGTDVSFENDPARPFANELLADTPGGHFLTGQIGWAPRESTINGTMVFDGAISGGGEADLGRVDEPVIYQVREGGSRRLRVAVKRPSSRSGLRSLTIPECTSPPMSATASIQTHSSGLPPPRMSVFGDAPSGDLVIKAPCTPVVSRAKRLRTSTEFP